MHFSIINNHLTHICRDYKKKVVVFALGKIICSKHLEVDLNLWLTMYSTCLAAVESGMTAHILGVKCCLPNQTKHAYHYGDRWALTKDLNLKQYHSSAFCKY